MILIHPGTVVNHKIIPTTINVACVSQVTAPRNTRIDGTIVRQSPMAERILRIGFTLSLQKVVSVEVSAGLH